MDVKQLTSASYDIVDEIEKIAGHSAILGDMRARITALRERGSARALVLLLKELLQWTNTLPNETRQAVAQQLATRGLSHLQRIDDQRVNRVIRRGGISTASEYRAVKEYVDNPPGDDVATEWLDKLGAMLTDFDVRKPE